MVSTSPTEGQRSGKPIRLSYHLVVYIDLLGQSAHLERIRQLPTNEEEKATASDAVRNSAGRVLEIRKYFGDVILPLTTVKSEVVERLPPANRDAFVRLRSLTINQVGFSDSFVVSVPLNGDGKPEDITQSSVAVHGVLAGAAIVSLVALSRRIPLRGGIEVGIGVDMFPNEVYGAVLVDVHRLESQVAEYPRTAVGRGLLAYLTNLEHTADNSSNEAAANYARDCRRFICNAPDDGWPMLHMLSPAVFELNPLLTECRASAHDWVREQVTRHAKEQNEKLFRRYTRLARYFDEYAATT
jgi:hypothetical protein